MNIITRISILTALILLLSIACSTDPSGSDINPSTLSVSFTGQTGKGAMSDCLVTAFWSICTDLGFNSYVLYRSEVPGISSDPSSADIVGEFTTINTSLCVDNGVTWSTEYYYALKTTDRDGNGVWSNEASLTTPDIDAPTPSVLSLNETSWYFVDLSWTLCPNPNFHSYSLYRSLTPDIEDDSTVAEFITELTWVLDTAYVDTSVTSSTTYYYALLTTNTEDMSSWSNEISTGTMTHIPHTIVAAVAVGNKPWDICSLPSGQYVYVTNRGDNSVSVIRTSDNSVSSTIPVGDTPYGICAIPSGEFVYVVNWGSDDVSVIRTSDNTVVASIDVGARPVGICALPSGEYIYVTNRDDDNVSVIRTSDNTVTATVNVGTNPYRLCSLPSGAYVYVTNLSSDNVSVIRTSDNTLYDTIDMYANPIGICAPPSGEFVYVSNFGGDNTAVIRTSDNTVLETIDVGNGPWGLNAHPSGECIYVANSIDDTVSIIRTSDYEVVTVIDVGSNPSSICTVPSGDAAFVVNYDDGNVSVLH